MRVLMRVKRSDWDLEINKPLNIKRRRARNSK